MAREMDASKRRRAVVNDPVKGRDRHGRGKGWSLRLRSQKTRRDLHTRIAQERVPTIPERFPY
jgi:hypothetical protein